MRNLENREGFDHCFRGGFGPLVERKTQGSRETSSARDFCDTLWLVRAPGEGRAVPSYEAILRFKTTAAAETKTRIPKKEKYNGR